MKKLGTFRAALLDAVPELATDPQKLSVMASDGSIEAAAGAGTNWIYCYTLTCIAQDFAGDMDVFTAAVLAWVAIEQPSLLLVREHGRKPIRFEAEPISGESVDLMVEIEIQEAVIGGATGEHTHPDEPPADPTAMW
jgi:P2 phage tail completion protein R (GpR).